MIIKIHSRGVGGGHGPVDYLLGKNRERENARLDRGNPDQIIELIDSSPYAQKYKSGVLSFAERDLEEQQKQQIMDSFEKTLIPGLDKDQYSILWVQHQDKERLELNFVVANVELHSGKRLQPYYDPVDRPRLNAWKDLINDHYKLHDPNDPLNKRELCTTNNLPRAKIKACEAITNGLLNVAERGELKSREDVVKTLEQAGFEIARSTKKSISIKDPEGGQNIRLKGAIYEQDFRFSKELRADIERASQEYRESREQRVQEARATLDRLTERKRESNQQRYPRTEQTPIADYVKDLEYRRYSHHHDLSDCMGHFGVSGLQNPKQPGRDCITGSQNSFIEEKRGQDRATTVHRPEEPQTPMYFNEQGCRDIWQWQSNDSNGLLDQIKQNLEQADEYLSQISANDRQQVQNTRENLANERFRKGVDQSTRADATRTQGRTNSLASDVREYQRTESETQTGFNQLCTTADRNRADEKQSLEQFNRTSQQLDQAITAARNATSEAQEVNKLKNLSRSYDLGR